ncbi:branched-chain amino acid ABC transporter ATP-binding protein (plasmid) [Rhizobium gallicum]|uniref:Branched-chain amino acid ABC transporter ATP-binding protein n=2 Tax=Rhizobium gallicum TaxID=56730 RepID=A0A1L5NS65_9HYPH|nr:branched-chain amino acid ABC transporter ATP-binding protein [Rhizobium gallicum]
MSNTDTYGRAGLSSIHRPRSWKSAFGADSAEVVIGVLLVAGSVILAELFQNGYWLTVIYVVNLYIGASVFSNLLFNEAGQKSLGQGVLFGLSAYGVGMATGIYGIAYPVAMLIGIACALVGGILYALPALRVQMFYLGFVTLSAAMVFPQLILKFNSFTQGVIGINVDASALKDVSPIGLSWLSILVVVCSGGAFAVHGALRQSRLGRRMRVSAESPEAAQTLGIRPGVMRSIAFLLSAVGTGLVGGLYPAIVGFVSPNAFSIDLSILLFFSVVVGGQGRILGPVVGVALLYLVPNVLLAEFIDYRLLMYGVIALLTMLIFPQGIIDGVLSAVRRGKHEAHSVAINFDPLLQVVSDRAERKKEINGAAIEVIEGVRSFGKVRALDGVNFTVNRGEVHGLVGANGSGKTSLLNVLNGLGKLSSGKLLVNGRDITHLRPHIIAGEGIGRTFQTPRIFPGFSVWENLEIGLDARPSARPAMISDATISGLARSLEGKSIDGLSHGQRRQLEVMRIVLSEADILLLDEPAAGLSPDDRRKFAELLRLLCSRLGKTVVLVEHDLDLVWDSADRITVMETGKVVAVGTPDEVVANPKVKALFVGSRRYA